MLLNGSLVDELVLWWLNDSLRKKEHLKELKLDRVDTLDNRPSSN